MLGSDRRNDATATAAKAQALKQAGSDANDNPRVGRDGTSGKESGETNAQPEAGSGETERAEKSRAKRTHNPQRGSGACLPWSGSETVGSRSDGAEEGQGRALPGRLARADQVGRGTSRGDVSGWPGKDLGRWLTIQGLDGGEVTGLDLSR